MVAGFGIGVIGQCVKPVTGVHLTRYFCCAKVLKLQPDLSGCQRVRTDLIQKF